MPLDALTSETRRWSYTGDGVAVDFPYANYITTAADLAVWLELIAAPYTQTPQTLTTHYSVSGVGTVAGGNVTFVTAPPSTHKVVIVSRIPGTQPSVLPARQQLPNDALTAAYHRIAALAQQLEAERARSPFRMALGDSAAPAELPAWRTFVNTLLGVDASGNVVPSGGTGSVPISAAMTPVVQAATLAAAEALLLGALLTTRGDIATRGASAVQRTAVGAAGMVLGSNDGVDPAYVYWPGIPSAFRLSLTTALAVTVADVTAAATIYLTPFNGNQIYLWDGTGFARKTTAELSLALDATGAHGGYHQNGKNFDLFVALDAGTLRLGSGPAWSSDTARGTGAGTTELELKNGVWTNKNSITLRFGNASGNTFAAAANQATYVGTFRATADGQTEDSLVKRFVWNAYNRRPRAMRRVESTTSWNYSTAAYEQANANAANQLDFVRGLDEDAVKAAVGGNAENGTGGAILAENAIGLDSTTVVATASVIGSFHLVTAARRVSLNAFYEGFPGLGRHFLAWLEKVTASGTTTWYGASIYGIQGEVHA